MLEYQSLDFGLKLFRSILWKCIYIIIVLFQKTVSQTRMAKNNKFNYCIISIMQPFIRNDD